ncbi:uncharacterized protein LOC120768752 [Bactrocera tryoni]|uniref:uncharacterized protein LOC120768752 n=1 Tax=Bactrocera tryoni TaxID=59916 RepID=UPI001A95C84B|nr:uncharacterized protein LOC120768752 [Bactrocera tryoni]
MKEVFPEIVKKYAPQAIDWQFIPPCSPYMGGLWETAGNHKFTYEEFSTLLARIEAVLNSRPVSPLSQDPSDFTALIRGHFLKGAPILAILEQGRNINVDVKSSSTPTMRSAVSAPRSAAGPIAAPRTTTAPAALRPTTGPAATTAPRKSTHTPALPADPQRIRYPLCRRPHRLSHCGIFKGMPPMQRQQVAQAHGYCLNCLATSHAAQECLSNNRCQVCVRVHHTLLHRTTRRDSGPQPAPRTSGKVRRSQRTSVTTFRRRGPSPAESRPWRQNRATSTRRHQFRPQSRRSTGLSSVGATAASRLNTRLGGPG